MKNITSTFIMRKVEGVKEKIHSSPTYLLTDYIKNGKLYLPIKKIGGIYIFWWTGDIKYFINYAMKCDYNLKGKQSLKELIKVEFSKDWIEKSTVLDKICLYIGKSTDIKGRISKHLKLQTINIWGDCKKNEGFKPNSESQLRIGIERVFEISLIESLINNISVTVIDLSGYKNGVNRFYLENYLIGKYIPLFNIDIER